MQKTRTNNQIRVPEVRVIDENGNQLGIMKTSEAISLAQERGFDLVEVSPQAKPPVTKFINFDKFRYQQKKLEQQQKKKLKKVELKNIRISLRISDHDLSIKAKKALEFLDEGHKIKVDLQMRGREQAHPELAFDVVKKFLNLVPMHIVESPSKRQGSIISTVIAKASATPAKK